MKVRDLSYLTLDYDKRGKILKLNKCKYGIEIIIGLLLICTPGLI